MTDPFSINEEPGWVSFNFNSAPGYDRIGATVHGTPEFVAATFGLQTEDADAPNYFNGKVSTLMNRAVAVDAYFKTEYAKAAPGK